MEDQRIAYHEAAHAVTVEVLSPGAVLGITLDGSLPWSSSPHHPYLIKAETSFLTRKFSRTDFATISAASAFGERLVSDQDPIGCNGDEWEIEALGLHPRTVQKARSRARRIVEENADKVARLAEALMEKRVMYTSDISELIRDA